LIIVSLNWGQKLPSTPELIDVIFWRRLALFFPAHQPQTLIFRKKWPFVPKTSDCDTPWKEAIGLYFAETGHKSLVTVGSVEEFLELFTDDPTDLIPEEPIRSEPIRPEWVRNPEIVRQSKPKNPTKPRNPVFRKNRVSSSQF